MSKRFMERPVRETVPVILKLTPALLIECVNAARAKENLDPIPVNSVQLSVNLPRGGDLSGTEFVFGGETEFNIRWEADHG